MGTTAETGRMGERAAAEFLRRGCAREDYLACVGRGMFALVCQRGSREAAQQRAEGLIRGLDGYLAGFRAEYAGAFRAGICSLEENPDYSGEAALYSAVSYTHLRAHET